MPVVFFYAWPLFFLIPGGFLKFCHCVCLMPVIYFMPVSVFVTAWPLVFLMAVVFFFLRTRSPCIRINLKMYEIIFTNHFGKIISGSEFLEIQLAAPRVGIEINYIK